MIYFCLISFSIRKQHKKGQYYKLDKWNKRDLHIISINLCGYIYPCKAMVLFFQISDSNNMTKIISCQKCFVLAKLSILKGYIYLSFVTVL